VNHTDFFNQENQVVIHLKLKSAGSKKRRFFIPKPVGSHI